mgnify:CR=1 FL=1
MAWKIRKELSRYINNIKFNVRGLGNDWYEIIINHPSITIEDVKMSLEIRDLVYEKMRNFEVENEVVLTITI